MALINRGRLSVQRVEENTWMVIEKLAERGGWEDEATKKIKKASRDTSEAKASSGQQPKGKNRAKTASRDDGANRIDEIKANPEISEYDEGTKTEMSVGYTGRKRKNVPEESTDAPPLRRSTRTRK